MNNVDTNGVNALLSGALASTFDAARDRLQQLDPIYFKLVSETVRVQQSGLEHPFPQDALRRTPSNRLGKGWDLLLGCTQSMYQLAMLWNHTSERVRSIDIKSPSRVTEYDSALRSWIDEGQSMVEHLRGWLKLATRMADVTPKTRRSVIHQTSEAVNRYSKEITKRRVGQFHGVVALQPIRGVAEDKLWEVQLAAGHTPESLHPFIGQTEGERIERWKQLHIAAHPAAAQAIAEIVNKVVSDLGWQPK
jgi:hypothetical protein